MFVFRTAGILVLTTVMCLVAQISSGDLTGTITESLRRPDLTRKDHGCKPVQRIYAIWRNGRRRHVSNRTAASRGLGYASNPPGSQPASWTAWKSASVIRWSCQCDSR